MNPETRIVNAIVEALKLSEVWCFKVHGGPMQQAGIPDLVGCIEGRFFALEVKVPGCKATVLQKLTLSRIELAGGIVGVVTAASEALEVLGLDERRDSRD